MNLGFIVYRNPWLCRVNSLYSQKKVHVIESDLIKLFHLAQILFYWFFSLIDW